MPALFPLNLAAKISIVRTPFAALPVLAALLPLLGAPVPAAAGTPEVSGSKAGERQLLENAVTCGAGCARAELLHAFAAESGNQVLATHVFNPEGGGGLYVPGTLHYGSGLPDGVWATDSLAGGVGVNLYAEHGSSLTNCIGLHEAGPGNTFFNWTEVSDPNLDGDPGQTPILMPLLSAGSLATNYGFWYDPVAGRWKIFNQDSTGVVLAGSRFLYAVPPCSGALAALSVHEVTAESRFLNFTWLADATARPQALLLVTALYDLALGGVFNNHPIGVWWDPDNQRWNIYNEDQASMPVGARFAVVEITQIFNHDFEHGSVAAPSLTGWSAVHP